MDGALCYRCTLGCGVGELLLDEFGCVALAAQVVYSWAQSTNVSLFAINLHYGTAIDVDNPSAIAIHTVDGDSAGSRVGVYVERGLSYAVDAHGIVALVAA